jgi:hypothetical protein
VDVSAWFLGGTSIALVLRMIDALFIALVSLVVGCDGAPSEAISDAGAFPGPDAAPADDADVGLAFAALDAVDQDALRAVSYAYGLFETHAATIWSEDFRFDAMPLVLLRRDEGRGAHAYLLAHPGLDGARTVTVPDDLGNLGSVFRVEALPTYPDGDVEWEFNWPVAGVDTMLFAFGLADEFPVSDPDWVWFAVHEAFHRYQDTEGAWDEVPGATQDLTDYPLEPTNAALSMVEDRTLSAALTATDEAARRTALDDFLVVRDDRLRRWPIVRRLDENQEKFEGAARYMEVGLDDAAGYDGRDRLLGDLEYITDPTYLAGNAGWYLGFDRYYVSGAAIGAALDIVSPGWEAALPAPDTTPADLLRGAVPLTPTPARLEEALMRHGYEDALREAMGFDYSTPELPDPGTL